jgi:YggT family protein
VRRQSYSGFLFGRKELLVQDIVMLIVDAIAVVLAGALLLRFWVQAVRVRPPMEVGQFIYQLTDWLVRPLRRILPGAGGYDWASLVGALLVALLATAIDMWSSGVLLPKAVFLLAVARVCVWALYGLIGLLIIEVIFSWVNPHAPLAPFIRALNDPLMQPLRRVIPPFGAIDLTPLAALILLRIAIQLVNMIVGALL